MKVLAISGWKQGGKDTSAEYLIEKYGATRVSFADPLKDLAAAEYDIPREAFDKPELKEKPILTMPVNPQDAFSRMLNEFMFKEYRNKDGAQPTGFYYSDYGFTGTFENTGFDGKPSPGMTLHDVVYWTPRALAILKGSGNRAVRSDFWVAQAAKLAKSRGGIVVISDLRFKSEMTQLREAFGEDIVTIRVQRHDTSPSTDPSERDLDDAKFDYWIQNRGTKEDLYAQLNDIMNSVL